MLRRNGTLPLTGLAVVCFDALPVDFFADFLGAFRSADFCAFAVLGAFAGFGVFSAFGAFAGFTALAAFFSALIAAFCSFESFSFCIFYC